MFVCIVERTFIFSLQRMMMNYRPASSRPPAVPYGAAAPDAPRPRIALR